MASEEVSKLNSYGVLINQSLQSSKLNAYAVLTPLIPVDLAGNLGGAFQYGKLAYGKGQYSRIGALAPILAGDLAIAPVANFSGDLAPIIVLAADLDVHVNLIDFAGGLAPQIALGGSLSLDLPLTVLEGGLTPIVVLGASSFVSGPLWAVEEPVAPPWSPSEPCPPSMWTPIPPPQFVPPSGAWTKKEKVDDLPVWGNAKK